MHRVVSHAPRTVAATFTVSVKSLMELYDASYCALLNFHLVSLESGSVKARRGAFRVASFCVVSTCVADRTLNGYRQTRPVTEAVGVLVGR